jgi:uncharacterized protein (DUF305 family)
MTISRNRRAAVALAALLVGACAGSAGTAPKTAPLPQAEPAASDPLFAAKARADSLRNPYTAADVKFMSGMIGHHAQAIVMARLAPSHGASAAIQRLCARIINAQSDEIILMQNWLRDRGKPVPEANPKGMLMKMGDMEHIMAMPGMLTEAQMAELEKSKGDEFDRLFLTYMIQHHKGAVSMVRELFASDGAGQDDVVFKFASDVNVDQTTEIARMELMLSQMSAKRGS